MKTNATPLLRVLNDLAYVLECVAQNHTGEAKHQLSLLCDNLIGNPDYRIDGAVDIAQRLQFVRDGIRDMEFQSAYIRLAGISRELWNDWASKVDTAKNAAPGAWKRVKAFFRRISKEFTPMSPEELALLSPSVIGGPCDSPDRIRLPDFGAYIYPPKPSRSSYSDRSG